jgi:type I restriction enzyme R subunit
VKLRRGGGRKGVPPPLRKVSVQEMIDEILGRCTISDEEALFIRQVTEQKAADPAIRSTVQDHRQDVLFLEGAYRRQVNGEIRVAYRHLERYEALGDAKYTDTGGIFDIMAVTVIDTHLQAAA